MNARDDAFAAVALDLFLGSGRIGAVVLSKKEPGSRFTGIGCQFCFFVARAWLVRASGRPGVGAPWQRGGLSFPVSQSGLGRLVGLRFVGGGFVLSVSCVVAGLFLCRMFVRFCSHLVNAAV